MRLDGRVDKLNAAVLNGVSTQNGPIKQVWRSLEVIGKASLGEHHQARETVGESD
jgi:hypothetical protein